MPLQVKAVQHMDLQRAEAAAECHMLFRCDALFAKYQYVVLDQGCAYAGQILRGNR